MQDTTSLTSFLKFMHSSSKPFYGVLCLQALFQSLLFTLHHRPINSKLRVSSLKATQKYPSSKPPQRRPSHQHRVTKQEKSKPTQREKRAQRAFLCTVPKGKARSPILPFRRKARRCSKCHNQLLIISISIDFPLLNMC